MKTRGTRSLVLLSLGLFLSAVGCAPQMTAQQRQLMDAGRASLDQRRYNEAVQHLDRLLAEPLDPESRAEALYLRGMSYAQSGRRTQAYADLHNCVSENAAVDATWRAYVVLGTLYFEDGRWKSASESLRAAASRMPDAPPKDAVLYRLGLCQERMGLWNDARATFSDIARRFPSGALREAADRRARLNADAFYVQCGAFGDRTNAENQRLQLYRKGFPVTLRTDTSGRVERFLVLAGPYRTIEDAERELANARQVVPDAVLWP